MTIVDTSVWIDFYNHTMTPESEWLDKELPLQRVGLTDLILCELLQGLRSERLFQFVLQEMSQFPVMNTGGKAMAISTAANYRFLRGKGHTVSKISDCVIATYCIENDYELLHRDRDFNAFEKHLGLRVIHPRSRRLN